MRGVKAQIPLNAQMLFYDSSDVSEIQVVCRQDGKTACEAFKSDDWVEKRCNSFILMKSNVYTCYLIVTYLIQGFCSWSIKLQIVFRL